MLSGFFDRILVVKTSAAMLSSERLQISITTSFKQLPQINIDSIHVFTFTFTHAFQLFRHFHSPAFQAESKHTLPAEGEVIYWLLKTTTTHTQSHTHQLTPPQPPQKKPTNSEKQQTQCQNTTDRKKEDRVLKRVRRGERGLQN